MSIFVGVGISEGDDSYVVGADACKTAINGLQGDPDLIILFASVKYDQEKVNAGVRSVSKNALLIGSSTAGEITTLGPAKKNSVAIMAIKSDTMKFYVGLGEHIANDPFAAGKQAADQTKAQATEPLRSFLMIPDVLAGNGADIVRGVLASLGEHFPVIGGASGDDFKFEKTYQHINEHVHSGTVVGLGITGDFVLGIGVKHGWVPVGVPRKVTRSEGSVVHELDGKPAISIYDDYFGKEEAATLRSEVLAKLAINYPLGMKVAGDSEMLIRDPLTVNEQGSITCAAEIPQDSYVQLMLGSRETAIQVAGHAAQNALDQLDGKQPKAVIIFNCIARNKLFGERSGEEIAAIQSVIGSDVPLIGFYTYGEQAPLGGEVRNIEKCNPAFHNETVVIGVIGEK